MQQGSVRPRGRGHRVTRRGLLASGIAVATLMRAPSIARAQASARTVRFASVGGITDAAVYLADECGFFRDAGIEVAMEQMASALSITAAIATGQVDVAGIAVSPGLYAAAQRGINLRVVGDKQSIRPGFSAISMLLGKPFESS